VGISQAEEDGEHNTDEDVDASEEELKGNF
jgi:hypothetical protein